MNNPLLFYLALVGAGVVLAIGWLAIIDLRQGKTFRFDFSAKQKAILTPKVAWLGFGWRALPTAIVLGIGISYRLPVLTVLALLSLALNAFVLNGVLRIIKVQAVVK
jgi:hypothetical protein